MLTENFKYIYFLKSIDNLGDVRISKIIEQYRDFEFFLNAINSNKFYVDSIPQNLRNEIIKKSDGIVRFEKEIEDLNVKSDSKNIKAVTILDNDYPENLKNIYEAPSILYYLGNLNNIDKFSLGIVGTRYPSDYGRKVCSDLIKEISKYSLPIISGLAVGVDSIAHKSALDNDLLTYAVLGSGVDNLYPPDNKKLYEEIIEKGAVLSEFEIGSKAEKMNFPKRNRIISGISLGTIIIESGLKGGSLITAEFALDQNRELFAIPGNIISKKSEGCNELIKKGNAKLISNVEDIISELNIKLEGYNNSNKKIDKVAELNLFENQILSTLTELEPVHIDKISELTGLNISDCLVNLLMMEFKDIIIQLPGKYFLRK